MPGKLLIPTLAHLNRAECVNPVASGGWHAFATAIHSRTRVSGGWHVIFQLDRTATWKVAGYGPLVLRAGWLAVLPPGTRFQGADAIDQPNAHAWLDLVRGPVGVLPPAEHRAFLAGLPRQIVVQPMDQALLSACRGWCRLLVAPPAAFSQTRRRAGLLAVLAELGAGVGIAGDGGDAQAVAPAIAFAETKLRAGGDVHVFAMAACCRLEATTFTRRFRAAHGRPPGDWLSWRRTELAVDRLQSSDDRVTDIAIDRGFASSQHLAVCCRRYYGATPSRLRAEARGSSVAERDTRRDAGLPSGTS